MENTAYRAIAIVGAGAILPDAPNVEAFWQNVKNGRYSISEVPRDRWDPSLYYDADHAAPDKTYSKIGGWVRDFNWDPVKWHLPIPPRVADAMDPAQKWAVACVREALQDYGYPERTFNLDRTAVILGNAMAGEKHYLTALRVYFPEYVQELAGAASFAALPEAMRRDITRELRERIAHRLPEITEDSMPGELANCLAGRVANLYNFHGPNYVTDAACASTMAAITAAVHGLVENDFDVAVAGGIDRNMGASTYVKFCKIGALSATGTRPYAEGADGFVMGEGAAIFLLKRLADAERDGDKIYAVLRGISGSSDGKGKGITAPNPLGQKICVQRAWENAGLSPATATLIEGHGTSTRVGDVVEVQSMVDVLSGFQLPAASIALGSVKSNIGHLKGAAGAAGLLKTALALHDKVLPPSVNCGRPNPDIDFAHSPLYVNTELKPWTVPADSTRRAGLSAFGFGGTNFHAVLEEYIPHKLNGNGKRYVAGCEIQTLTPNQTGANVADHSSNSPAALSCKAPLRGALVLGATSIADLSDRLSAVRKSAESGNVPSPTAPKESDLHAPERLVIDYADAADLVDKATKAQKALQANQDALWKALRAQGIYRGSGLAGKVAFLYTGQGSQYVNMLKALRATEPIVAQTFAEADDVMTPLLGKPLSKFIFVDHSDADAVSKAEADLRQTAITQPAVLAADLALTRLLAAYGVQPDMAMGHSLGEYGALVAVESLSFKDALEAVSARGREMTRVSMVDNGRMAAVFAPLADIERTLAQVDGYVVIANINSNHQAVIGGASNAVMQAVELFLKAGYEAVELPVSHAFHTSIVAPASEPLRQTLQRLKIKSPRLPIVANVSGEFYPTGPDAPPKMVEILAQQVASPVQFVKGLNTLWEAGARVFVETGPKKALHGFVEDVLGEHGDVVSLFTNHPKFGDVPAFNQALCGLYAAGLGQGIAEAREVIEASVKPPVASVSDKHSVNSNLSSAQVNSPVTITGAALGLPGTERIFDDSNVARILRGEQFIDVISNRFRRAMLDKNITRLVKSDNGGPVFEAINNVSDVIKLAGRGGAFDPEADFGISGDRAAALDRATSLAIAAGIDALRDAGIPLIMRYKTTSKSTQLPDRWGMPDSMRDDTGVIFASAFPGFDAFADQLSRYYADRARREEIATLERLQARQPEGNGHSALHQDIALRLAELRAVVEKEPFQFDRRFLFKTLSMGHSQFAEFIGARGPNTQINSACASTTQAVTLAEDWIRAGRCRRVVVIAADDVTSDHLMEWMGAGFLASGAAATDEVVENAALPFDRRRHGLIMGMGAAALVIESVDAARERGIQPICEVLGTVTANSAFHGSRLDVQHIADMMEALVAQAEDSRGISRHEIAGKTVFVSHETYTPARGGSASAEIQALRRVFGEDADRVVIANTKGFTGHPMAAGIEDVVAVKALETGCVPPVANFKEVDPELGSLNLSKGGFYPVEYALRLGAGFGSQISMVLLRWISTRDGVRPAPTSLGYSQRVTDKSAWDAWLARATGSSSAELEVVHRTLRIRDEKQAARSGASEILRAESVTSVPEIAAAQKVVAAPAAPVVANTEPQANVVVNAVATKATRATESDPVKDKILALVAEKTGYPVDMLDLDLDLEADLGVDTVKQAEMLAAVREIYSIPRDENLKLRDFPTLTHVIRFVYDRCPDLKSPAPVAVPAVANETNVGTKSAEPVPVLPSELPVVEVAAGDPVKERILDLVVEKTGYPKDMLDLDLDLEADLGVDTVKQAELLAAIREIYSIPRDENLKLRDFPTLHHVIQFVYDRAPNLKTTQRVPPVAAIAKPEEQTKTSEAVVQPSAAEGNASPTANDEVKARILDLVVEKTGYPKDMLDLDLDLEADLGVDTVKQAELLAAIREIYSIPRDENLKLRDFPTLKHVIQFVYDRRSDLALRKSLAPEAEKEAAVTENTQAPLSQNSVVPMLASLDAANSIPRRVPVPVLRPPLAVCKYTAAKLAAGSRVVLMPDKAGVADELAKRLDARGIEVLRIEGTPEADALADTLKTWIEAGPVQGVYWLPALDNEGSLTEMDPAGWTEALRVRVKALYTTMRVLYEQVAAAGTFLISATRLGGQHGYDEAGAVAPLGGPVVGFTKAYKRERADVHVKAVDFSSNAESAEISELLIEETLRDPGAVEIGYKNGQRWTIGLQERPASDGQPGVALDKNTVFLVTGAAGGIVSAITADLASASGGTFHLLDLVPEPDPNSDDLKRFVSDRDGLKRDLFARIQARGERATPALVEKELAVLERAQAAEKAIEAVRAAGGTVHYYSVNLTDSDAVANIINQVRKRSGRIDVLLHAAGMERSHFLPDKDPREFDLVFDVKSHGWFNLLRAIGDMPLGATVVFSSVAGRFGNAGQADYSSANDLLCKITSSFRTTRPATRGIAIDWTAWGEIGMATRGSIPKMMELAGIDMLPPEAGIPYIRRELTAGATRGEVVVGQRLGVLVNELDSTGGLDVSALEPNANIPGPMIGKAFGMGQHSGLRIETTLDPKVQPFLHDHCIDGTAVLPGVMGIEAFAEAAASMVPYSIASIEQVNFLAPFKFYRNSSRKLLVDAMFYPQDENITAECRLMGIRKLPKQAEPEVTTHFTGRVCLTKESLAGATSVAPGDPRGATICAEDIYRVYFHGPAYRVLERAWRDGDRVIGQMSKDLPPDLQNPDQPTLVAPRLIELCFQTAGLWEMGIEGRMGLPSYVHQLQFYRRGEQAGAALYAVVTPAKDGSFDAEVVDAAGNLFLRMNGYRTVALPYAVDSKPFRVLQTAKGAKLAS